MTYNEPPDHLQNGEYNSTELQQCGWCKYASGTHRYNYCISGHCSLQKSYSQEIAWNTSCFFLSASKADIKVIIDNKVYQIKEAQNTITRQLEYCAILGKLRNKAQYRPCLPGDRDYDHFNIGDPVAVWINDQKKWYFGEVKMGYRHHDGCVSYRLDGIGPQAGNDQEFPYNGGFWGSGCAVPYTLLLPEWEWFKDHPVDYVKWCDKAYAKSFNGKVLEVAFI